MGVNGGGKVEIIVTNLKEEGEGVGERDVVSVVLPLAFWEWLKGGEQGGNYLSL